MPRGKGKKAAPKRKSKRLRQIDPTPTSKDVGKSTPATKGKTKASGKKAAAKSKAPATTTSVDELDKKILEMQEQKDKLLALKKKKSGNRKVLPDSSEESSDSSSEEEVQDKSDKAKKGNSKKSTRGKKRKRVQSEDEESDGALSDNEKLLLKLLAKRKAGKVKSAKKKKVVLPIDSSDEESTEEEKEEDKGLRFAPAKPAVVLDAEERIVDPRVRVVETAKLEDSLYSMLGASHSKGKGSLYIERGTVDLKIKKRIWLGEYIDLGLLASRSEQKPKVNVESHDGVSQVSLLPPKVRVPANIDEWRKWWCIYATIYTSRFALATSQMFAYENKIFSYVKRFPGTFVWRLYDEEFRKLKQSDVDLNWHETHQPALNAILDVVMGARDFSASGSNVTKKKLLANG
ncbi:MAG: hypothetical protein GY702_18525, partial [Desulfobulbaceae bacterium]|nr:hypothetical protein [Desulfobulbaceae bacterium]